MPSFPCRILSTQFDAALCMLDECIRACPEAQWDAPVAKYTFWQVAYHTLCFTDFYLSQSEAAFRARIGEGQGGAPGGGGLHPKGMAELDDEYPSRRFVKAELEEYATICRGKSAEAFAAETDESLAGPSGFSRLPFSRAELHIYSTRHIQHHAGQLAAVLRRAGVVGEVELRWVRSGWR